MIIKQIKIMVKFLLDKITIKNIFDLKDLKFNYYIATLGDIFH